jgi:SWI/SNF chromatin-remodeling complex subunit SWI1
LKKKLKADKSIGFSGVMLRILRKFMMNPSQNVREFFHVCSKRAIEAMKLIDDEGEVVVDKTPTTSMPALSFGMGWHETGEKKVETGFGMLGGFAEDITMSLMLSREVDNSMFNELESMIRVEF